MNPDGAIILSLGLLVGFGILLTLFRLINFIAGRKLLPLWIPFVLLIGIFAGGSLYLDTAGAVHEVRVTEKREVIRYSHNFYSTMSWWRDFSAQVELPPGTETPGVPFVTINPDAASYDAMRVGQPVKVRLLQLGDLFRFARLADRSTFSMIGDLLTRISPPEPRGPWREAAATVLQVDKITEHRSRRRRHYGPTPLPWPYQIVRLSYTPPGRNAPVEVMDNIEIASQPDLAEGRTVKITWAEDNPREARIVGGSPGRPWANRFYVFGETLAILALLIVILFIAGAAWRRRKRRRAVLPCFILSCCLPQAALSETPLTIQAAQNATYNIVSIVTDDQAIWSIGAYGAREAVTPNMDRLAREGARFNNAFVTTPVCSPSRVAFLTGLYGTQAGITDYLTPDEGASGMGLPASALTWPGVLQQNGYRTALFGKYHLGTQAEFHPTRRGFHYFMGSQQGSFAPVNPRLEVNGRVTEVKGAGSDIVMDDALRWIEANKDRPFAALIHFREPHLPYTPMPEEDTRPFKNLDPTIPDVKGLDREQVKQFYRDYYASVHAVDRNLGRLLAALERLNLDRRTIVIFQSDHGYNIGHHGIHSKGNGYVIAGGVNGPKRPNMWDTSLRIPLLIRWPGVLQGGTEIDETVLNLDMFPSVLGMLKIKAPPDYRHNGKDFSPLLFGLRDANWRTEIFGQYDLHNAGLAYMRMLRTTEWKLVRHYRANELDELYDLKNDPGELRNLYKNPGYRDVRERLQQRLDERMKVINDPITR
ncbi:MAG: sulfatase-like hydrolase/transferase [Acidobacteriota bacterium]|nr:MAG: sulfatase-like hydrolase/transferase [Acidobacteriota bacterium]